MNRCRNCGEEDHITAWCIAYGPWYPAPDMKREDYAELAEKISALVAADILAEHEAEHAKETS